ncbi:MAG TPA: hypothetical protein VJB63_04295, partial [Patescibacteria group bacterium]|nr:hypothetical protein [Patescibacteria group bacterium]
CTLQLLLIALLLSQSGSKTATSPLPGTALASPPASLHADGLVVLQSLALVVALSPLPPTQ